MSGRDVHRTGTAVLSVLMIAVGAALIAEGISRDGVISARSLLGLLFVVAGLLRLRLLQRRRGEP